jgi:FixJ family two-component response regulator
MSLNTKHIFIVDDDSSFGRSLQRLLNAKGYYSEFFESAEFFLDSVPFDQEGIAIADIHMPDIDGLDLIRKMHEMSYAMPVILVTGRTEGFTRNIALKHGAAGFLMKPFNEKSLFSLINNLGNVIHDV